MEEKHEPSITWETDAPHFCLQAPRFEKAREGDEKRIIKKRELKSNEIMSLKRKLDLPGVKPETLRKIMVWVTALLFRLDNCHVFRSRLKSEHMRF